LAVKRNNPRALSRSRVISSLHTFYHNPYQILAIIFSYAAYAQIMQWKPLPTDPDVEVSELGDVSYKGVLKKPFKNGAYFCYDIKSKTYTAGRLTALAHLGAIEPFRVRHANGDLSDAAATNIVWIPKAPIVPESSEPLDGEDWRSILDAYGIYEVSSLGRVRRKTGSTCIRPTYVNGYAQYTFSVAGKRIKKLGHIAVLETFGPPRPTSSHECDHINNVRSDNRLSNLQWLTKSENVKKSFESNGFSSHQKTTLSPELIAAVLGARVTGASYNGISVLLRVPYSTVMSVCAGDTELSRGVAKLLDLDLPLAATEHDIP
jgi:hypothetical protein